MHGTCSVRKVKWSISPSLPDGFTFDTSYGRITGKSEVVVPRKEYNITAVNAAGSYSFPFYFSVSECSYGKEIFFHITNTETVKVILTANGETIVDAKLTGKDKRVCIPYKKYQYKIKCESSDRHILSNCGVSIEDYNKRQFKLVIINYYETCIGEIDLSAQIAPYISPVLIPFTAYSNERTIMQFQINGVYDSVSISPPLPDTIQFERAFNSLIGLLSTTSVKEYTITIKGPNGSSSSSFTIAVNKCPEGMNNYILNRKITQGSENLTIFDKDQNRLFFSSLISQDYHHFLCFNEGIYTLRLQESYINGWCSELYISDGTDIIGNYTLPLGYRSIDYRFVIHTMASPGSIMKYSRGIADSNWSERKYRDKKWSEASVGKWGSFEGDMTTVYFRKHFSIEDPSLFTHLIVDMTLQDGCVAYLNDREVLRRNLPIKPIDASTLAIASYTGDALRRSFVPVTSLRKGDNVMSVEVHRSKTTPVGTPVPFDMSMKGISSPCIPRNDSLIITDDLVKHDWSHPAKAAFTDDLKTSWITTALPATLTAMFPSHHMEYINFIRMDVENEYKMPKNWRVEGINEDNSTDVIYKMESKTFLKYGNTSFEIKVNSLRPYSGIQFVFNKQGYSETIEVFRISLLSCNHMTCPNKWGNKQKTTGDMIYGKCPLFLTGHNQLTCSDENNIPVWKSRGCLSSLPPQRMAYIDTYLRSTNTSLSNWFGKEYTGYDSVRKTMESMLNKKLKVGSDEISYPLLKVTSSSNQYILEILMRFTVEYKISDYILEHELSIVHIFNDLFHKESTMFLRDVILEVVGKPKIYSPLNIGLIVLSSSVLLIIILAVVIYFRVRSMPSNGRKSLKSIVKNEENDQLLQSSV